MLIVTRELKLALIVGFSLVLVVTVLVSDHLSRARNTTLDPTLAETPPLTPRLDPETAGAGHRDERESTLASRDPRGGTQDGHGVNPVAGAGTGVTSPPANPPVELTMGRTTRGTDDVSDLERAVRSLGGEIRDGRVYLPPAAGTLGPSTPGSVPSGEMKATWERSSPGTGTPTIVTPPPAPPAMPDRMYTVVAGDSAYKIAKRELGDGELWRSLVSYNKGVIPESGALREGMKIKLPPKAGGATVASKEKTPEATPAKATTPGTPGKTRTYVIKKGDTLGLIAQRELGTVKRLQELIDLNKDVLHDPDVAPLGVTLKLPAT